MREALIIFVKNPILGQVKTRLAASIGDDMALLVYQNLLKYTKRVASSLGCHRYIYYHSHIDNSDIWEETEYTKRIQAFGDLGNRMKLAFQDVLDSGMERVCLIGSDCPSLTHSHIESAMDKLKDVDIVIGPSLDGGYYLIGLKAQQKELFENIEWSTNKVLSSTLSRCKSLDLKVHLLPQLSDVDVQADLLHHSWLLDKL